MKYLLTLCCFFLYQISFAETCPNVNDIKHNSLNGWKIYDSEEGTPLSHKRQALYRKRVEKFVLAEWPDNNKLGIIHCYYRDHDGSDLEAYLAKRNFSPKKSLSYWYKVTGYTQCAASKEKCEFNQMTIGKTQLAERKDTYKSGSES